MPFRAPECFLEAGIVSINGTAYWISAAAKLVSFNLDKERVPSTNTPLAGSGCYYLTEVHGRLGFVVNGFNQTNVWVLEEEGRQWILRYKLDQCVSRPHFAYAAESGLAVRDGTSFNMHRWKRTPGSSSSRLRDQDVVLVVHRKDKGTPVFASVGLSGAYAVN